MTRGSEKNYYNEYYKGQKLSLKRRMIIYARSLVGFARGEFDQHIFPLIEAKNVLEIGCGDGSYARRLAESAERVVAIDISPEAVNRATAENKSENLDFEIGDVENLSYPESTFDVVVSLGVVHHADRDRTVSNIKRVLKPGGCFILWEPLAHNVLIKVGRKYTSGQHSPDEHPLTKDDCSFLKKHFIIRHEHFFYLTSILALAMRWTPWFEQTIEKLDGMDQFIFKRIPSLRWHAWQVFMVLQNSKESPSAH